MRFGQARFLIVIAGVLIAVFPLTSQAASIDKRTEAVSDALSSAEYQYQSEAEMVSKEKISEYRQKLDAPVTLPTVEEEERELEFDWFSRYMPSRSLEAQPGKMSIWQTESELSYNMRSRTGLPLEFSLTTEYIGLNDKEEMAVSLPAKLTGIGFGAQVTLPFFNLENTYLRMRVIPSFYTDDWNYNASSLRIPSHTFLIYQPQDNLVFIVGAAVYPSYETPVYPILGMIYKPDENWTFNLIPDKPTIEYAISSHIALFLEGGVSGGEFKVNKDGYKGAILQYNEAHGGAGAKLKLNNNFDASLSFGRMFNRNLKYRDSRGKVTLKNDYYTEFRIEIGI